MNNNALTSSFAGAIVAIVIALVGAGVYVGVLGKRTSVIDERLGQLGRSSQSTNDEVNALSQRVGALEAGQSTDPSSGTPSLPSPGGEMTFTNSGPWGRWSDPVYCPPRHHVCGLRQKVEQPIDGDDTAMNAVSFYCCPAD